MSNVQDEIELERFKRDIPLAEYASSRGFTLDKRESSRSYVVMRKDADKIVIKRGQQKDYWVYYNPHDSADHGTIVDFVARRGVPSLGAVRQELRPWLGEDRRRFVPRIFTPVQAPEHDRQAVARDYALAKETRTSAYLCGRGLRPETLSDDRFRGMWRQEADGKVLFPHRDREGLSGFERKGKGFTGFATGGRKGLWHSHCRADDTCLVLAESAIDAMSYHQLKPQAHARYVSVGGAMSAHQRDLLAQAIVKMPAGSAVVMAFDNDEAGRKLAKDAEQLARGDRRIVRDAPPSAKDWNDFLKVKERDFIRSVVRRTAIGLER